jgi:hypothetical protein
MFKGFTSELVDSGTQNSTLSSEGLAYYVRSNLFSFFRTGFCLKKPSVSTFP